MIITRASRTAGRAHPGPLTTGTGEGAGPSDPVAGAHALDSANATAMAVAAGAVRPRDRRRSGMDGLGAHRMLARTRRPVNEAAHEAGRCVAP